MSTAEQRTADEEAVLRAFKEAPPYAFSTEDKRFYGAQLFGFAPRPLEHGFTVARAVLAAKRLEKRGALVGIQGDTFHPRSWRLPDGE